MAEMYAHERLAKLAAEEMEIEPYVYLHFPAYLVGANGPDILFYHKVWLGGGRWKLSRLGSRMHCERTDAFLGAMLSFAHTEAQRAYILGFLCHFALDHQLHPYVYALCQKGCAYERKGGHGYLEEAIDSTLYLMDTKQVEGLEPPLERCGVFLITPEEEEEIDELLCASVAQAFEVEIPRGQFKQAIAHTRLVKRALAHPTRLKLRLWHGVESVLHLNALITSHCNLLQLPPDDYMNLSHKTWRAVEAPDTPRRDSVPELLLRTQEMASAYMTCAQQVWRGEKTERDLFRLTRNRSYCSDIPDSAEG